MEVPIYTGGALTAQVKIATAQQQAAVASYGAVVLGAFKEVEGALTNQALLAQRLPFQEHAVADRTESVRIAGLQYKAGAIDLLCVLQLQETQIAARSWVRGGQRTITANLRAVVSSPCREGSNPG
jgi:multidrug efflux system outer membrane protein